MANHGQNAQEHRDSDRGTMDISEQLRTWNGFWAGAKWSLVVLIVIMLLLAIFRTN